MKAFRCMRARRLLGRFSLPGDKSIAHRAVILAALSKTKTTLENFPFNQDCLRTLNAFKALGVRISSDAKGRRVTIYGRGLCGLRSPAKKILAGESGTTLRLLAGLLSGQRFGTFLDASPSLRRRPMSRITIPLRKMGARISAAAGGKEEYPPIRIRASSLSGIRYRLPVASAQVKSALLFAGLYAAGKTRIVDPFYTRDHTERMLKLFGARIKISKGTVVIQGNSQLLSPGKLRIPGDISSAGFFIIAALILPGSRLLIKDVSLNPTRTGLLKVLQRMGAFLRLKYHSRAPEPYGDIMVTARRLKGTVVRRTEIPSLIDELPVLMVASCLAKGRTVLEGVGELRVKETDRISSMCRNLNAIGGRLTLKKAGSQECIVIEGVEELTGGRVRSYGDHRTAMSMVVASVVAQGPVVIDDVSCIKKSFPDFLRVMRSLSR
ncbi:MAG TPA: 3-phosphoshikimate 1-carboxyvinyltransferase [Patescibacteria group bacterium]|nr:3-phosphoshikimate 1-carboxyvinyltransferase [Patescibacteria group bacterium]